MKSKKLKWLYLLAVALVMYAILPQLAIFKKSMVSINQIQLNYVLLAILSFSGTYLAAAFNYVSLSFSRLKYWQTALVQLAASFANRILPAGIGNIGLNYAYLVRQKHTKPQAAAVVAMSNSLGFAGHILLTAVFLVTWPVYATSINPRGPSKSILFLVLVVAIVLILIAQSKVKNKVARALKAFMSQLRNYTNRPLNVMAALTGSVALTIFNLLGFWFCIWAFGVHLSLVQTFVVFTLGVAVGTATPTPGGIGGAEAGLTAGLVAFGLPSGQALSIALLYRLIYFWLALVAGGLALLAARKQKYI